MGEITEPKFEKVGKIFGGDTAGKPAGNSSAKGTGPEKRTGEGTGKPAGTGASQKEKERIPGLASVEQGEPKKVPIPEPGQPEKTPRKPRKPRKKKEPEIVSNADQISAILVAASGILGSRPGLELWTLSKEEADSIAKPAFNLLEKSESFAKLAEHSDAISLVMACGVVFIPRAIATASTMKEKKKRKHDPMEVAKNAGKIENHSTEIHDQSAAEHETSMLDLFDSAIPLV